MNATRAIRAVTIAAVLAVAAVAGWVSYRHAVTVVSAHGESGWVGRMYPATVDGLIIAASMVLLDAARHRDRAPALAVWLLAAGITATLAANVLAGAGYGPLGAVVSAWPALAFVGCYELLMLLVRASARRSAYRSGTVARTGTGAGPGTGTRDPAQTGPQTGPQTGTGSAPRTGTETGPADRSEPVRAAAPDRNAARSPNRSGSKTPDRNADRSGRKPANRSASPVSDEAAEREFAAEIATGQVPTLYQIRTRLHVGNERAKALRQHIARQALTT